MNENIKLLMDTLKIMRNEAFTKQNQELHKLLGRVMADVIRVKEYLGQ